MKWSVEVLTHVQFGIMSPFERLDAFHECHRLALLTYRITMRWPAEEKYGIVSQIRRAAFSAAANIVEGSCRRGAAEFARFLSIAHSSLGEVEYCIRFAKDLGYLDGVDLDEIQKQRATAGALTWRLYEALARSARRKK